MPCMLTRLLQEHDCLLADGAIGTNLFARGLQSGDAPEMWNLTHSKNILSLHRDAVAAGTDILITNTFGANRYRLQLHNATDQVEEINRTAITIARQAADEVERPVVVAASMGPTGELYVPTGTLRIEDGVDAFAEQAKAQAAAGADVHWIETISSKEELEAAVKGASVTGLPIVATMTFDTSGRTMMGLTPQAAMHACHDVSRTLVQAGHRAITAFGSNCGVGAATLVSSVHALCEANDVPDANIILIAKGNCGIPRYEDGQIVYSGTPDIMATYVRFARAAGARIIGGCCGTTPKHLQAMRTAIDTYSPMEAPTRTEIEQALGPIDGPADMPTHHHAAAGDGHGGQHDSKRTQRRGRRQTRETHLS